MDKSIREAFNDVRKKVSDIVTSLTEKTETKLLWTNPNPTSEFTNQIITVDGLSNYDEYEILFKFHNTVDLINTHKSKVGYGVLLAIHDSGKMYRRNIYASGNTLEISAVAGSAADNNYLIPYQIYGVKLGGVITNFSQLLRRWCVC